MQRRSAILLAVLPLARAQPNMGEPLSEILMISDDDEFREAVHGRASRRCWAVLFVNREEEQMPSISMLEVRVTIVRCAHARCICLECAISLWCSVWTIPR